MKQVNNLCGSLKFGVSFIAVLFIASAAFAQERAISIMTDPRMVVIPVRSLDEVRADIDNAESAKGRALYRQDQAENRLKEIDGAIETRKTALKNADHRKNEAKKGKRESEIITLQIESKANQQAIDLLKRLKDLRKAEIEEAKVEAGLADIGIRVLKIETELQGKRTEYSMISVSGASDLTESTIQQVLRELEVRLLKLQEEQAAATQKMASKRKDVISHRMKLHKAQLKLGMPRA